MENRFCMLNSNTRNLDKWSSILSTQSVKMYIGSGIPYHTTIYTNGKCPQVRIVFNYLIFKNTQTNIQNSSQDSLETGLPAAQLFWLSRRAFTQVHTECCPGHNGEMHYRVLLLEHLGVFLVIMPCFWQFHQQLPCPCPSFLLTVVIIVSLKAGIQPNYFKK